MTGSQMEGAENLQRYHIVVGVDYGTTYSGVSYILSKYNDISKIVACLHWPTNAANGHKETGLKVPSRIAYAEENNLPKNLWGYEVKSGLKQYSWMKLHLDKDAPRTEFDDPDLKKEIEDGIVSLANNRTAEDVTSDYFKEVYNYTMELLESRYKKEILQITAIKFWMTKPVIWSDEAEVKTLRAAKTGGFGSRPGDEICLISEPEAAAFATISSMSRDAETAAKAGDSVLICDCGGGTVDLVGYILEEKNDKWHLKESCPAIGGKCGGTSVDRNLRKWMSSRYGAAFDDLPLELTGPGSAFMKNFERNKKVFGTNEPFTHMELEMDLENDDDYYDLIDGVGLDNQVMKILFDPVVQKIKKLIQTQIDRVIAAKKAQVNKVFLVGGFGDSPYLQQQLQTYLSRHGISLNVPQSKSWGAVAKGAVVRGLEMATVDTRRCRRSYGTTVLRRFRENIDSPQDIYWHPFNGKKYAMGYMGWCVEKGAEITSETRIAIPLTIVIDTADPDLTMEIPLCSCDDDKPPDRYDETVKELLMIKPDLSDVDFSKYPVKGTEVNLAFEIVIMLGDKQGTILFQCVVDEEVVGDAEIEFTSSKTS